MGTMARARFAAGKSVDWTQVPSWLQFLQTPTFEIATWVKWSCGFTMAAGTYIGGWKIIHTLGHKLVRIKPIHGFAAECTGATILYAAGGRNEPLIQKVDAAFAVTTYHTATAGRVYSLTTDAADVLWFGADSGLFSFNGTTETKVPVVTTEVRAISEITGTTAKVVGDGEIYTIDVTTGAQTSNSALPTTSRIGHHAAWVK